MSEKEVKHFRLISLFGLHRGWTAIIAFVLFVLLLGIVPSFFHMGRRVYFTSNYYPFALSIDDRDMYLIPGDVYLKPGIHTLKVHINDKELAILSFKVRPSLFYSWLIEGTKRIYVKIDDENIEKAYDDILLFFLKDSSVYQTVFEETPTSQIRSIYSDIKTELPSYLYDKTKDIIDLSSRLISSQALEEDAQKNGIKTNVYKFGKTIEGKSAVVKENKLVEKIIGGKVFVGNGEVWLSKNLVSEKEYNDFVEENPKWSLDNLASLIENDDADFSYMQGFTMNEASPISNVPLSSSLAYLSWFSKKHNVNAKLPSKNVLLSLKDNVNIDKNVEWEFTDDVFENSSFLDGKNSDFSIYEENGIILSRECMNLSKIKKENTEYSYPIGVALPYISYPSAGFRIMIKGGSL